MNRLLFGTAAAWSLAATTACLRPPVDERVTIRPQQNGGTIVSVDIRLDAPGERGSTPAGKKRVIEMSDLLLEGRDPWTARLRSLEPSRTRTTLDESRGVVRRSVRHAEFADAAALQRFFADTPVKVDSGSGEGWAELTFEAGTGGVATSAERRQLDARLEAWLPLAVGYFASLEEVLRYLDSHPDRAGAVWGSTFADALPESAREELDETTPEERELLERFNNAAGPVIEAFEIQDDETPNLEELSRKVHDPFPAPVVVFPPGPVLEVEGFGAHEGRFEIAPRSIWQALKSLEGRWLAPDPVVAMIDNARGPDPDEFDLPAFVARHRVVRGAPSVGELRDALARQLTGPPVYRVRWSTLTTVDVPDSPFEDR